MKLIVLMLVVVALVHHAVAEARVVCYYESWAAYNGVSPEDLDASLCTHINYAFMSLWDDGNVKVDDDYLDVDQGLFYRVTDLKKQNPNLKVLLSVGGASVPSSIFSSMISDSGKRGAFKGSIGYFIETYNFDGLDIDWEYPEGGDRDNFNNLLRELRSQFNEHGWLLTAAVSADPDSHGGYDVREMNNQLDYFNVMTYDMYGGWSAYTGQNSALYASSVESSWERQNLNIDAAANNWANAGASRDKVVIGLGFYGRSFTLADPNQHGIHAPIAGTGVGGGYISYLDICTKYNDWTRVWDNEQRNPYKYSGNQWFGYDDGDSIWIKTDYAKANGFGGVMIWAIDLDDVHGACSSLKQSLLRHINGALGNIQCC